MESRKTSGSLEKERNKLIRLICKTLELGIPITLNERILEQSRKVDALVTQIQEEMKSPRRDHQER